MKTIFRNLMTIPNTNSTAWPERVGQPRAGIAEVGGQPFPSSEIVRKQLALLAELEASLSGSQQALLSRNLSRLEQRTAEQARLHYLLSQFPTANAAYEGSDSPAPAPNPSLSVCLRAARQRVLRLGRTQQFILQRARGRLHVLSNVLAGPHAAYAPVAAGGTVAVAPHPASLPTEQEA